MPLTLGTAALLLLACATLAWQLESRRLATVSDTRSADVDSRLQRLAALPSLLSGDGRWRRALEVGDGSTLAAANALLRDIVASAGVEHAYLLDDAGDTIAASNHGEPDSFVGKHYGFRRYFLRALAGDTGTQYGIGRTTGIPGYFVAHAVSHRGRAIGVLALKLSLGQLQQSWAGLRASSVLVDDLGFVILAREAGWLYRPAHPLPEPALAQARRENLYPGGAPLGLDPDSRLQRIDGRWYLFNRGQLSGERWALWTLSPLSAVAIAMFQWWVTACALLAVAVFALRDYWRQRQQALAERRNARELRRQVAARSRELEQAQQALITASNFEAVGQMSGAIAHEINQPLASLRLNLASLRQLSEQAEPPIGEMREVVADCDRTTKRLSRIIASLRHLRRDEHAQWLPVRLAPLLRDTVDIVRRERPVSGQWLATARVDDSLSVPGDDVLMQQALLNLIYNALDAVRGNDQPAVRVGATVEGEWIAVTVDDNGAGVDPALRDQLFRAFVGDSRERGGLGLGLAIALQIIRRHSGELLCESSPGGGTRFTCRWPAEDSHDG